MREAPCPGRCATPGAAGSRATGPLPAAWVSARPSVRGRSGGHTGSLSLATRMLFQGPAVAGDGVQAGRCLYLALPATCAPSRLPPAGGSRDDPAVLVQGQAQWHGVLAPGRASSAVTSEAAAGAWPRPRSLRELGGGRQLSRSRRGHGRTTDSRRRRAGRTERHAAYNRAQPLLGAPGRAGPGAVAGPPGGGHPQRKRTPRCERREDRGQARPWGRAPARQPRVHSGEREPARTGVPCV